MMRVRQEEACGKAEERKRTKVGTKRVLSVSIALTFVLCPFPLFPQPKRPPLQEAGYDESAQLLVEDVMMSKNVPDPRDIRKYDLIGVFGMVNYRTLRVSMRERFIRE